MHPSFILAVVASCLAPMHVVQAGQILSHLLPHQHGHAQDQASRLDWNSQVATGFQQRPMDPSSNNNHHQHQQQWDAQPSPPSLDQHAHQRTTDCPTNDRVYLPDMQSFLIGLPMTYQEAMAVCQACGSELVLVDGANVDRLRESFQSLGGRYSNRRFWVKSWFGQRVPAAVCPAVEIDPLMDSRLTPVNEPCQARLLPLCY